MACFSNINPTDIILISNQSLTGGRRSVYGVRRVGREGGVNAVSLLFSCRRAALTLARVCCLLSLNNGGKEGGRVRGREGGREEGGRGGREADRDPIARTCTNMHTHTLQFCQVFLCTSHKMDSCHLS